MKTHIHILVISILAFLALAAGAPAVLAATGAAALADPSTLGLPWAALIIAITPAIVAAIKWLMPKLPTFALPVIAALTGYALSFASTYLTGVDVRCWQGLLLGLAGVGAREVVSNFTKPTKTVEDNAATPSYGENPGDT